MEYANRYFEEVKAIAKSIDLKTIEKMVQIITSVKVQKGRMFFIGVGGSAANCSHAVNDFRKIGGIESYTPGDNVAELTARTNDEGWDTVYAPWLECSQLSKNDLVFVFSVGGGSKEKNISVNLIKALELAKSVSAKILGIIGRDGGYTKINGDNIILIPNLENDLVTPLSESFQAIIWHSLVSSPKLQINKTKW